MLHFEYALEAVVNPGCNGSALDFIPRKWQDKNVLLKAVESKPDIIESIPYNLSIISKLFIFLCQIYLIVIKIKFFNKCAIYLKYVA